MNWHSHQHLLCLVLLLLTCANYLTTEANATPVVEADADADARHRNDAKFVVISEDVIPDVENTTQKVIRVNPQDLPPIKPAPSDVSGGDSSLYKIKSLLPAHRNYVNSKHMRKSRPNDVTAETDTGAGTGAGAGTTGDSVIHRAVLPLGKSRKGKQHVKKKRLQLHFLYNQPDFNGKEYSRTMNVHIAPGAYPVYYVVAKTNGRYNKAPIKAFRNENELRKYLVKTKSNAIEQSSHNDAN